MFKPGFYTLDVVNVSLAAPLLTSTAAFFSIGKAWGDDGGVEIEFAEDDGDFVMGASGFPTWVGNNNDLAYADITVTPSSNAYRKLGLMYSDWMRQVRADAQFIPIAFTMIDRSNGDRLAEPMGGWISAGVPSKVKAKTDQTFRLGLPNAKSLIQRGPKNLFGT